MDRNMDNFFSECLVEILPPERDAASLPGMVACPCCQKMRSASCMDEDGCGVCDECLAP